VCGQKWGTNYINTKKGAINPDLISILVIDTDCIGSCKSNYHAITTTTVPTSVHTQTLPYIFITIIRDTDM
jgi:hypothetical protein